MYARAKGLVKSTLTTTVNLSILWMAKTMAEERTETKTPGADLKQKSDLVQKSLQQSGFNQTTARYFDHGNIFSAYKISADKKPGWLESSSGVKPEMKKLSYWSLFNTVNVQMENNNNKNVKLSCAVGETTAEFSLRIAK